MSAAALPFHATRVISPRPPAWGGAYKTVRARMWPT